VTDPITPDAALVLAPEVAPPPATGPADWVRRNLLRSPVDAVVTVVAAIVVGYVLFRLGRFIVATGRWTIVRRNLSLYLVGRFPRDELWRVGLTLCAIAAYGGLLAGFVHRRQELAGRPVPTGSLPRRLGDLAVRLWPLLLGVGLLLALARTIGPWILVLLVIASALAGRVVGGFLPRRSTVPLVVGGIALSVLLVLLLTDALGWDDWGGMMLNVVLAAAGIALSFPLGVLLALGRQAGRRAESVAGGIAVAVFCALAPVLLLVRRGFEPDDGFSWLFAAVAIALAIAGFRIGRRSTLPLVRVLSVVYIEFFRGVPLYVLLFLGYLGLRFFLPAGASTPGLVVRATVVFTVFTAAYIAEIVRGGLQSLPRGQTEAAQALGLSPVKTNLLIVLPQALRNVIPAIVGQFISLFKDTTLAGAAIGLLDMLNVGNVVTQQPEFRGQALHAESLSFVMFVFWVGCITMSRESQRLERKLGVGTR
jgi:general L-amino acid transport system permease protein